MDCCPLVEFHFMLVDLISPLMPDGAQRIKELMHSGNLYKMLRNMSEYIFCNMGRVKILKNREI